MIYFIGAGPGDPELLTLKGKRVLSECQVVIYAGSLVNPEILRYVPQDAELHDSSGLHLEEIITLMEKAHLRRYSVARLHSGDPSLYGALREQIEELTKKGIPFTVIPGVSSFLAGAASLKRELTVPGVSQTVILTRIGGRTPVPEKEQLRILGSVQATLVIFLSIDRLGEVVKELLHSYPPQTPAAVLHRVSWKDEQIIWGTLSDIVEKGKNQDFTRQALIIVGEVLGDTFSFSSLYEYAFSHGLRKTK